MAIAMAAAASSPFTFSGTPVSSSRASGEMTGTTPLADQELEQARIDARRRTDLA